MFVMSFENLFPCFVSAKGAKDSELDVTLASNAKNELLDVHTRVHIDDDDPHKWLTGLGHREGNDLLLVLGAWWPATCLPRMWGWEKEILLGLVCTSKWWWMVGALRGGAGVVVPKECRS